MRHSLRRSWSSAGTFKESSHFCTAGESSLYRKSKLKRASQDPLGKEFALGCTHGGHQSNIGSQTWKSEGLFSMDAKGTMQTLNDRLAAYLDEVDSLEKVNHQLERKINEWYEKNAPQQLPDFDKYFKTINELQKEIFSTTTDNTRVFLHIDNARLAGDDLQNKYNMEFSVCNTIEADLHTLRRELESQTLERCNLEFQIEYLMEELVSLKKTHEEEVEGLKAQLGARVNVEVDVAPAIDLSKVLLGIRNEYESLMEQNQQEIEIWFLNKSEELNCEMVLGCEQLQLVKSESIDLRHTIQALEIELQMQLNTKSALEDTMAEIKESYCSQLAQIQDLINNIEAELRELRQDLNYQNNEYKILMNVKTCLEMEIATYRRLLDGEDTFIPESLPTLKGPRAGLKIMSVTEEFKDGKFVSKHEQIHHLSPKGSRY